MIKTFEDRKKECAEELSALLKKHGFRLDCSMYLKAGEVTPIIDLVELPKEDKIIKP